MSVTGRDPLRPRARPAASSLSSVLSLFTLLPFLLAFDPLRSPSAAVEEGNAKMKAGKAEDALGAYDKALTELSAEPGVHFDRGTALAALSRFDEAAAEFLRGTESKDAALKAAAFYNLGNVLMKKDKHAEAVEAFKHALALNPKDDRAKWNLEIALKKKREDDKKKKDDKKDDKKDEKQPPAPEKADDKQATEREIESVLDGLEKSPKDLEKQRAMMRAVRRAPPSKDW